VQRFVKLEGPKRGWQLLDIPFIFTLLLFRLTLSITSWIVFFTEIYFWLVLMFQTTALATVIDLGHYAYRFRMHLLLLELAIFWTVVVELHTGVNLCRIMFLSNPKPNIPRELRRDIIFRGTTAIHMSSLVRDNFLFHFGGESYVYHHPGYGGTLSEPVGTDVIDRIWKSSVQPASDYAHEILRTPPEDGPLYAFSLLLGCLRDSPSEFMDAYLVYG
jgi:hypothetical protein